MLPMRSLRRQRRPGAGAQPARAVRLSRRRPRRRPRRQPGLARRTAGRPRASPTPTARSGCTASRACSASRSSRSASGTRTAPTARWRPSSSRSTTPSASATATCSPARTLDFGRTLARAKVFHVSPFCETRGDYAFRFMRTDLAARDDCGRTAVRVELHVDGAPLLLTSVSGRIEPLTPRRGALRAVDAAGDDRRDRRAHPLARAEAVAQEAARS